MAAEAAMTELSEIPSRRRPWRDSSITTTKCEHAHRVWGRYTNVPTNMKALPVMVCTTVLCVVCVCESCPESSQHRDAAAAEGYRTRQ